MAGSTLFVAFVVKSVVIGELCGSRGALLHDSVDFIPMLSMCIFMVSVTVQFVCSVALWR